MKKIAIVMVILLAVVIGFGYGYYKNKNNEKNNEPDMGGDWYSSSETLVGSSSNLVSLPKVYYFANSTTTPPTGEAGSIDGGGLVTQKINTTGFGTVILQMQLVGNTATSTFAVRQMGSQDDSNYFDIASSTDVWEDTTGTTTISILPKSYSFDPGTATTSLFAIPFNTYGYRYTRFVFYGENIDTDPNDGVQAWITAIKVENSN